MNDPWSFDIDLETALITVTMKRAITPDEVEDLRSGLREVQQKASRVEEDIMHVLRIELIQRRTNALRGKL